MRGTSQRGTCLVMMLRIHRLIEVLDAGDPTDYAQIFQEYDSELLA